MNPAVQAFIDALSIPARKRLERDPDMTVLIERAIGQGWEPTALADHVGYAIFWATPANGRDVMLYRLTQCADGDM